MNSAEQPGLQPRWLYVLAGAAVVTGLAVIALLLLAAGVLWGMANAMEGM